MVNMTPKQDLVLWKLLITGEEPMISALRPKLDIKKERQPLVDAGLIRLEKRGQAKHIILEDKAWDWMATRIQDPDFVVNFPASSPAGTAVLATLLQKLGAFLRSREVSLAEFCYPVAEAALESVQSAPTLLDASEVEQHIQQAYTELVADSDGIRVRLAHLRQRLDFIDRDSLDAGLLALQRTGRLTLIPMENPKEIGLKDQQAAIDMGDNDKRYFIYLKT